MKQETKHEINSVFMYICENRFVAIYVCMYMYVCMYTTYFANGLGGSAKSIPDLSLPHPYEKNH